VPKRYNKRQKFDLMTQTAHVNLICTKMFLVEKILTLVGCAPVVAIADPVTVAAVEVPCVVVGEDSPETIVDHILD
jgi:hypothetical protein